MLFLEFMRSPGPQQLTRVKVRPENGVIDAVTKFCKQEKLFSHEKPYILHMFLMIITFTIFVQLLCSFDHHDSLSRSKIICEQHFFRCAFKQEQLLLCPQAQVLQGTRFLYVTPNIFLCRIWSTEAPKDSVTASLRYTRRERETLMQKV